MRTLRALPLAFAALAFAPASYAQSPGDGAMPVPTAEPAPAPVAAPPVQGPANAYPAPNTYPPPGAYPPPGTYPPPGYAQPGYYAPPPGYYPAPGVPMVPENQLPGYHEHDGFYMRLSLGFGYFHTSASYKGMTQTISGGGPALNCAFGGVIAPNLIIFGELSASGAIDPTWKRTGYANTTMNDTTVNLVNFGPGVAYYFEAANLYLSGAITISQMSVNYNDDRYDSDGYSEDISETGVGGSFMIGKEWWVTRDWGFGIASMLQMASMKVKDADTRWFTTAWSVLFSATYN